MTAKLHKTALLSCVAVLAMQAGAAVAAPSSEMVEALKSLTGAQEVTIGREGRFGNAVTLNDVRLVGQSQDLKIGEISFPGGLEGGTFEAVDLRSVDVFGEIGGASADVIRADTALLQGLIDNSLFVFPCDGITETSKMHAENVTFWSDLDMASGVRGSDELSRVAVIDADVILGDQCSEIINAKVSNIAARGVGGSTGYIEEAQWQSNPGLDKSIRAQVHGFRALSATGQDLVSVSKADISLTASTVVADMFTSGSLKSAFVNELQNGAIDVNITGLSADLSQIIPAAREGGFDVPAGHRLDGDLLLRTTGGANTTITANSLMEGFGNFYLQLVTTMDPATNADGGLVDFAHGMKISYGELSVQDRGFDALITSATGATVAQNIDDTLEKLTAKLPAIASKSAGPIFDEISSWVDHAFKVGSRVTLTPQEPVSLLDVGMSSMGGTARLADRLGLQTRDLPN
jgi:hypothetical protein